MRDWAIFGAISGATGFMYWRLPLSIGASVAGGVAFGLLAVLVLRGAIVLLAARASTERFKVMAMIGPAPFAELGFDPESVRAEPVEAPLLTGVSTSSTRTVPVLA